MVAEVNGPSASVVSIGTRSTVAVKGCDDCGTTPSAATEVSKVSLTSDAKTLASLEKAVQDAPVVDSARVQSVQKAIADGSYQVDPAAVADRLVRMESLLASAQPATAGNADA